MDNQTVIKIKRGLEDRGYTQVALAEELSCAKQSVSRCLRHPDEYPRIRDAIIKMFGRDPWKETAA